MSLLLLLNVLVINLCIVSVVSQGLEYCVVPDAGLDSGCPLSSAPRHTLQYYAANSNFTSAATFHFLEGQHSLDTVVEITGVVNLSMIGVSPHQDSSIVVCGSGSAGFFVQDFINFRVEKLSFFHCGVDLQQYRGTFILTNGSGLNIAHVTISNSSGYGLAAVSLQNHTSINNSVFSYNRGSDTYNGGNVIVVYTDCLGPCHLQVNNCVFSKGFNKFPYDVPFPGTGGLLVHLNCMDVYVTITNSLFDSNKGYYGGNLYIHFVTFASNFVEVANITSSNGHGGRGNGMFIVLDANLPINDPVSCGKDSTREPHHLMELSEVRIINSTSLGALFIEDRMIPEIECSTQYVLIRDSLITRSVTPSGESWGGDAVRFSNKVYSFKFKQFKTIQATFKNVVISWSENHVLNLWWPGGAVFLQMVLKATFIDCTFENNKETAIAAQASNLVFQGNNTFRNNSAFFGSGLMLLQESYMILQQDTHITFADNHASSVGGAIYVDSSLQVPGVMVCFFQVETEGHSVDPASTVRIDFINNTADYAGSSLYIPSVDCNSMENKVSGGGAFWKIFKVANTEADPSAITYNPVGVCLCMPGQHMPNCSMDTQLVSKYPGQNFTVRLAVVGSMDGTVPGAIHAHFADSSSDARFGSLQDSQTQNYSYCNDFTYTVFSTKNSVDFFVAAEHLSFTPYTNTTLRYITVDLRDCPIGFALHDSGMCVCDPAISRVDIQCFISNQTILRPANTWIGFMTESGSSHGRSNNTGVVFCEHCPHGYCLSRDTYLSSDDPNTQCVGNRTGLLCGECVDGYSLTLGGQKCSKCSNSYLLLVLPLAASGLTLVGLLFALNLTVTKGSINGLIFYANIVAMSQSVLYPGTSSQLYIFIAWLNLDLGINTCFYDGLDAYTATWLQFVFPLYLWVMIVAIVVMCNKFPKLTSTGTLNAVKVLATLFLISYTKLQRTLVTILSFTTLRYPSGAIRYVWLYDANVEFLKGKHLPLFIAGVLVLVILIVPYTFGLALFQYLQACSKHRVFWWVNGLKPVFDAYAGPYKDKYRMWTGLLLVTRTLLIILFSLNITGSPDFNHFSMLILSLALLMFSTRGIYMKWRFDVLETFFYVQLGVFSGSSLYAAHNNGSLPAVADFSIGTSFLVFLLILGYHIFSRLPKFMRCHKKPENFREEEEEEERLFQEREEVVSTLALATHCA